MLRPALTDDVGCGVHSKLSVAVTVAVAVV